MIEERIAGGREAYESEKDKYFQSAWSGLPFQNKARRDSVLRRIRSPRFGERPRWNLRLRPRDPQRLRGLMHASKACLTHVALPVWIPCLLGLLATLVRSGMDPEVRRRQGVQLMRESMGASMGVIHQRGYSHVRHG